MEGSEKVVVEKGLEEKYLVDLMDLVEIQKTPALRYSLMQLPS